MTDGQKEPEELPSRERLERLKLQAETQELKKWFFNKSAFWVALSPLLLVFAGIAAATYFGVLDIQKENRKAKIEILNRQIETLEANVKDMSSFTNWYDKGVGEYVHERYNEAINSFTKAIEVNPENPYPYNFRGVCYKYLSKFNEALTDFKKSTDYRWDNPRPHLNMADIYLIQDTIDIDKAEEEIKIVNGLLEKRKLKGEEKAYAEETIKQLEKQLEEAKKK